MANEPKSTHIQWHESSMSRDARLNSLGLKGATLWFTGLSGSGKSTVAVALEKILLEARVPVYRLDGDNLRHGLNRDLGFSPEDRKENIRRVGEVGRLFADSGMICLVSFISPYQADRDLARSFHSDSELPFIEVFVDTPVEMCEERDPKGLYKKARAGEIPNFTGVSDPYEAPENPELAIKTGDCTPQEAALQIISLLEDRNKISPLND